MAPQNKRTGAKPITAAGIEELKAELAELEGPRRIEMADRIRVARELGDLKENADYHTAKDDQSLMATRIKRPQSRLRMAVVVEADDSGDGRTFAFGKTAEVLDEGKGETVTWTLVGSTEANLAQGKLSPAAPKASRSSSSSANWVVALAGVRFRPPIGRADTR